MQDEDNSEHILVKCAYARQVWHTCFQDLTLNIQPPVVDDTFLDWWIETRMGMPKGLKRGYNTFVILVGWELWKQWNACVFNRLQQQRTPRELVDDIVREVQQWRQAGVGVGGLTHFVRE